MSGTSMPKSTAEDNVQGGLSEPAHQDQLLPMSSGMARYLDDPPCTRAIALGRDVAVGHNICVAKRPKITLANLRMNIAESLSLSVTVLAERHRC